MAYAICRRCIMDTSDPDITFDADGVCSHCHGYDKKVRDFVRTGDEGRRLLGGLVERIKADGAGKPYDCIIGVSGGVDSTFVAWKVKELGLRPLAVHLDNGWDSEIAVSNIITVLRKMGIDLHTEVLDWEEFKDIQLSFLRASVPDAEIPSDHAIFACLYHTATKFGLRHVITGVNIRTETHLPSAWSHGHFDFGYIKAVQDRYGSRPIRTFPHYSFYEFVTGFRHTHDTLNILDYVDYSKSEALVRLQGELGWRDYGGKHYESIYTRWYQGVYLPRKFGYDKRRSHMSSRICSGELSREFALEEIKKPAYPLQLQEEDSTYVAKKLGLTRDGLEALITVQPRSFHDFPSYEKQAARPLVKFVRRGFAVAKRQWGRLGRYWSAPVLDERQIVDALRQLAPDAPPLLFVHSSLSACGRIRGGAPTVIRALRSWKPGTLAMPAHSYCYPTGDTAAPVFDAARTPSVVGAITDAFWREPGVRRSLHPTHSLAVEGQAADSLIGGHEACDTPCGRGTPYDTLVQQDAAVLMFGATMHAYTLFHTAEDAAAVPYLYGPQPVALRFRTDDNVEHGLSMRKHDMTVPRSFREKATWLEERGLLRRVKLGNCELLFVLHARQAHEALIAQLRDDPMFLTAAPAR